MDGAPILPYWPVFFQKTFPRFFLFVLLLWTFHGAMYTKMKSPAGPLAGNISFIRRSKKGARAAARALQIF